MVAFTSPVHGPSAAAPRCLQVLLPVLLHQVLLLAPAAQAGVPSAGSTERAMLDIAADGNADQLSLLQRSAGSAQHSRPLGQPATAVAALGRLPTPGAKEQALRQPWPPPSRGIRLIGLGHGRTGTQSFVTALNILGYHAAHGELFNGDCGAHPNATVERIWRQWCGNTTDFSRPLQTLLERGYDATSGDNPLRLAWKELMRLYPEAPVVLTEHPKGVEGWLKSLHRMKLQRWGPWASLAINDEEKTAEYTSYNKEVEEACRAEGRPFLRFSVAEGWGPLCSFLGVSEPDVPFPHQDEHDGPCVPIDGLHLLQH